jgi:hypothetical protein
MEHDATYMVGLYRAVEQIEKVKDGYEVRVTAYDDEAAREMPWHPLHIILFDSRWAAPTLSDARRGLKMAVDLMRQELGKRLGITQS